MKLYPAILGIGMLLVAGATAPSPAGAENARAVGPDTLHRVIKPWIGAPYRYGGVDKRRGTDCSGFVRSVAREGFAVELPRSSRAQFRRGVAVSKDDLRAGDLVFFATGRLDRVNHVGIYMGRGRFAHASESRGVVDDALEDYKSLYRGARRIFRGF